MSHSQTSTPSPVSQSGTGKTAKIGINTTTPASTLDVKGAGTIRGTLSLPSNGTATASNGANSQPMTLAASSFNSSTSKAVTQTFQWQAEPAANDTISPSGTLNLLFGSNTNKAEETGLNIASSGLITFAAGQTFPGTGDGTITGVTTASGSGLSGGGTGGTLDLSLTNSCAANQVLQWSGTAWTCTTLSGGGTITGVTAGTDLTGGGTSGNVTLNLNTSALNSTYAQLAAANTKTQAITALRGTLDAGSFTPREAAALKLVDRIVMDPHSVDDGLFAELRRHFNDEEIIELVCASNLFTWAGTLNTVVLLETGADSPYGEQGVYATAN